MVGVDCQCDRKPVIQRVKKWYYSGFPTCNKRLFDFVEWLGKNQAFLDEPLTRSLSCAFVDAVAAVVVTFC